MDWWRPDACWPAQPFAGLACANLAAAAGAADPGVIAIGGSRPDAPPTAPTTSSTSAANSSRAVVSLGHSVDFRLIDEGRERQLGPTSSGVLRIKRLGRTPSPYRHGSRRCVGNGSAGFPRFASTSTSGSEAVRRPRGSSGAGRVPAMFNVGLRERVTDDQPRLRVCARDECRGEDAPAREARTDRSCGQLVAQHCTNAYAPRGTCSATGRGEHDQAAFTRRVRRHDVRSVSLS